MKTINADYVAGYRDGMNFSGRLGLVCIAILGIFGGWLIYSGTSEQAVLRNERGMLEMCNETQARQLAELRQDVDRCRLTFRRFMALSLQTVHDAWTNAANQKQIDDYQQQLCIDSFVLFDLDERYGPLPKP